jgi:hypothetical protein
MAVLIEAISVVVPVDVLEEQYPGGCAAFEAYCPNSTFCCDGHLARVGFMTPADTGAFIGELERKGLTPMDSGRWRDLAVVDQHSKSATAPCDWLSVGYKFDGPVFALLEGDNREPIEIAVPAGWRFEGSLSQQGIFTPSEQKEKRYEFLRTEGMVEVYRDRETGKEVFVGRPAMGGGPIGRDDN